MGVPLGESCDPASESCDLPLPPSQYASWDLAFHMIPFAKVDPDFAMNQLMLFLREWYMAPNGQIPAYEFAFGDVNPPVHAWAVMRIYKMTAPKGKRDGAFLAKCFQKLILNFNWYVWQSQVENEHYSTVSGLIRLVIIISRMLY